jgi:hypothetical protein
MRFVSLGILCIMTGAVINVNLNAQPTSGSETVHKPGTLSQGEVKLANEAIDYSQNFTDPILNLKQANYSYLQAVTRIRRARTVEKKRQELLAGIQTNKEKFKMVGTFYKDSTLRSELIRYLDLVYIVLKEDFDKILDMEDIKAQAYDEDEAHQLAVDMAFEKLTKCHEFLTKTEDQFFEKYKVPVNKEKDELTLKIEKANRALSYYDTIYRIFLKVNRENAYAKQTIDRKDIASLEQHAMTLVSLSEAGLEKLKQKMGLDGDNELILAAIKLLEYYKHEGLETCPANVEFLMKGDNFLQANKKYNSIREDDRTQEDINRYNDAVKLYNKAAKEINKLNSASFKMDKELIEFWNKQMDLFFERHS